LDRDAGGSSGGTGAAIAANFGAVGIGEDTGGSIRVPSSFNNLVGLRVTPGLISRNGICPFKSLQDTAGPMTRTVKDTAILLDILVGYDPTDPFTVAVLRTKIPQSYSSYLDKDGLKRARIGILRGAFGSDEDPDSKKVNEVINRAVEAMRTVGAEIIDPVSVPNLQDFIVATSLNNYQPRHDINSFLAKRPHAPVHSIEEIYRAKQFHPVNDGIKVLAESAADPEAVPEYFKAVVRREQFQAAILNVMALHRLDAIAFPDVRVLPPLQREASSGKWSIQTFPTNTVIASNSGLPAISMPAGFSEKIPIGLELIGKPYDEPTLIKLAHSFEQATHLRRPPESTPPLRNEF
jgi:Asp-tRNA(Asn)/Glu-tRNA(Gln) amidotransferase A subunit family amidase